MSEHPLSWEWSHRNANGGGSTHKTREEAEEAQRNWVERCRNRTGYAMFEPPPPESVGIFKRLVGEWEPT